MSIKPIDFQVMIPKMPEVAKHQGTDAMRQHLASQQGVQDIKQMAEADAKGVYKKKDVPKVTSASEQNQEDKAGSGKKGKKRQQQGGAQGGEQKNKDESGSRFIDIKL